MTKSLENLIDGYSEFRKQYLGKQYAAYRSWAGKTQEPKVMMIACSDSRVNPAILTHAGLGEVFMVNNVANLVPPYRQRENSLRSTSAALEYAVVHLEVEHIIVLGHSGCGGIKALMQETTNPDQDIYSFIEPWVKVAAKAKERVLANHSDCSEDEQYTLCEKESLLVSLDNLASFPWLKNAIGEGGLTIHAWHFNVETGLIEKYDSESELFTPLLEINHS